MFVLTIETPSRAFGLIGLRVRTTEKAFMQRSDQPGTVAYLLACVALLSLLLGGCRQRNNPASEGAAIPPVPANPPVPTPSGFNVKADAGLRSGPGDDFDVTGEIRAGERVMPTARSRDGGWVQLPQGWIKADALDDLPLSDLPIVVPAQNPDLAAAHTAFASGLAQPKFFSPFYMAKSDADDIFREDLTAGLHEDDASRALANLFKRDGEVDADRASVHEALGEVSTFYYLGFNHSFDNWYADPESRRTSNLRYPRVPKFRIGLRHGSNDPEDDDFDHFRIRITDSSGDDVLGFDAATVADSLYEGRVLVLGNVQDESTSNPWLVDESEAPYFATVKRSNRVEAPVDAYYGSQFAFWRRYLDPAFDVDTYGAQVKNRAPRLHSRHDEDLEFKLSSNNLLRLRNIGGFDTAPRNQRQLFALPPVEIYDMEPDAFGKEGNYTFEAWAEDDDGHQISPKASITLNIRERFKGEARSNHTIFMSPPIYPDHVGTNAYNDVETTLNVNAVVLDLSIVAD